MSNRIINIQIHDIYISAVGGGIGASGSGNATTLRLCFDEHWDGTSKTVHFLDSNGENEQTVLIGVDTLISGATYDINVPALTLAVPGLASMSVIGVELSSSDSGVIDRTITTQALYFQVLDSGITGGGSTMGATDVEQLQSQIDALAANYQKRLQGASNPNAATAGGVGQLYINTTDNSLWICTASSGAVCTWTKFNPAFTMDTTPTAQSNNAVTSNGVKSYVDTQIGNISTLLDSINGEVI